MANIRVDVNYEIKDGSEIVFRSPADCSAITGLKVYYAAAHGKVSSRKFMLADAHGHNVGDIDHLFAENVVVKVILDVTAGMAYVQNADTNAYLERRFNEMLPQKKLAEAVNNALAQAKANGEFKGETGATGPQGPAGADGAQGPAGPTGPQGPAGPAGPQGPAGADGAQGPKGDTGVMGYSIYPCTYKGNINFTTGSISGFEQYIDWSLLESIRRGGDMVLTPRGDILYVESVTGTPKYNTPTDYNDLTYILRYEYVGSILGPSGKAGDDYVLTDDDLAEIAELAAKLVDVPGSGGGTGADGYSPIAYVNQTADGAVISITDKSGTTTATITNGKDGKDGKDGAKGDTGATGPQGPAGPTGPQGPAGADGAKGDKGDKGETGATGSQGPKGDKGDKGDTGAQGPAGDDYVLTVADKTAIAELAAQLVEVPEGGSGTRGPGILQVSTAPSAYTTATGGQTPTKRMKLSTIMSEASVSEVLPGDAIRHSYYLYPIYYVDGTYAYTKSGTSIRGASGSAGAAGAAGKDGADGADGYTPVRGVDYWTSADQESIVQQVIAALGTPVFGTVDESNNIILSGNLADGTYTLKYEDEEGNLTTIGTLKSEGAPKYTNILPLAQNADGSYYVGPNGEQGYTTGYRLNSSGVEAALADWEATGFIPVDVTKDVLYFKNIQWRGGSSASNDYIGLYNSSHSMLTSTKVISEWIASNMGGNATSRGITQDADGNITSIDFKKWATGGFGSVTASTWSNVKYIRFSLYGVTADSIITKNEPIE